MDRESSEELPGIIVDQASKNCPEGCLERPYIREFTIEVVLTSELQLILRTPLEK